MPENPPKSERYLNRALTWLGFNERVLAEAEDGGNALLERARFLGIAASNLDEFFMIRVAGLRALARAGLHHKSPDGLTVTELLARIAERAGGFTEAEYRLWERDIASGMADAGIHLLRMDALDPAERAFLDRLFARELLPLLTPAAAEESLPFPRVGNLVLTLAVRLEPPGGGEERFAIVALPRALPRWIQVGSGTTRGAARYVLLEDVVRARLGDLFSGHRVLEAIVFRITRDADFATDDQESDDLFEAVKLMLKQRRTGDPVRLELEAHATAELEGRLLRAHGLAPEDSYRLSGPLDLRFLMDFARLSSHPAPRAPSWPPQRTPQIPPGDQLWDAIAERDFLLFHPYESFEPVLRLLNLAADDPGVLAIKQILYRTSSGSEVVRALERAAENGKQVTVLVELQARFDEERNVTWAERLETAGAQVLYGLAGLKTHAKALLIVRRGPGGIERYAQVGTGNYNERTALEYSDLSLLTSDDDLCADLTAFFNVVTGYSEPLPWRKIAMAPLGLRNRLLGLIRREIERSSPEEPGRIRAKMNSLVDTALIDALYDASRAGVVVDLNVRGSCVLRPGVKGLSENIRVVTIVDRFLEHSRIFEFRNGGDPEFFIGSADWMPRNLDRRVELMVPVQDPALRARLSGILDTLFADNVKGRELRSDGTLAKRDGRRRATRAQEQFWEEARERAERPPETERGAFEPRRRARAAG
jgi:polyphosphate kinase